MVLIDLTGQRFGKLIVIERAPNQGRNTMWKCQCDCGSITTTRSDSLRSNMTRSCGCLIGEVNSTHGMSRGDGSYLYEIWKHMRYRCTNPNNHAWKDYGGRGIIVCERWMDSFENFYEDMGHRPSPNHSIDRIDNNGNYDPTNCRWATASQQQQNKRNNRK